MRRTTELYLANKQKTKALEAAKYLIQLYMSTKYKCDRQKLQKLIIFAHYALKFDNGEGLIDFDDMIASNAGLGVLSISDIFNMIRFNGKEVNNPISEDEIRLKSNMSFRDEYRYDCDILTYREKYVLYRLFLEYGAYPSDTLVKITKQFPIFEELDYSVAEEGFSRISRTDMEKYTERLFSKYRLVSGLHVIINEINEMYKKILAKGTTID